MDKDKENIESTENKEKSEIKSKLNKSNKLLSDIVAFRSYAKYLPHKGRRETLDETIERNMGMHISKFPQLEADIREAFKSVQDLKIMPSMRALQFGGRAIESNNIRQFNCAATPVDRVRAFAEILFVLLSGTGMGFSVQRSDVGKLPSVRKPKEECIYIAHDSIEGWAECLDRLMNAYFFGGIKPVFDLSGIRDKGSYLSTTGAKAPGSEPLKIMLEAVERRMIEAIGRQLSSIEVHDIVCIVSDAVLAGGIRRSALISLFDRDDEEMLNCKQGSWWETAPWRARANNSAVLPRGEVTKEEFKAIYDAAIKSDAGEPGFYWTNAEGTYTNPCFSEDTLIKTREGDIPIKDLVGREVEIHNGVKWAKCDNFRVTAENQEMLKITMYDGSENRVTPYHTVVLSNGKRIKAKDLKPGYELMAVEMRELQSHGSIKSNGAYLKGFLVGDGTSCKGRPLLFLYSTKYMCESRLIKSAGEISNGQLVTNCVDDVGFVLDDVGGKNNRKRMQGLTPKKHELFKWCSDYKVELPVEIFQWNLESKLEFIAGVLDADGTAQRSYNSTNYQLCSINKKWLLGFQTLLKSIGVRSKLDTSHKARKVDFGDGYGEYDCKECYRLSISKYNSKILAEAVSFDRLDDLSDVTVSNTIKLRHNKVIDISVDGVDEKVYCCTIDETNTLALSTGNYWGNCVEISLNANQFCNLTTMNLSSVEGLEDFLSRCRHSAIIGTLQASYTDYPYIDEAWAKQTAEEALLGCSLTGICDRKDFDLSWLREGAKVIIDTNVEYAAKIGINRAARLTTVKPEGSASCVLGTSSGIHSRHAPFYLRRVRMNRDDSLAKYLMDVIPELCEDDLFSKGGIVVTIPQKSPEGALFKDDETAIQAFSRTLDYSNNWIQPGHVSGSQSHNVSVTLSYRGEEVAELFERLWAERNNYNGVSLLPYDGGTYKQAPFEVCDEATYERLFKLVAGVDLRDVKESKDYTNFNEIVACAGGLCELNI